MSLKRGSLSLLIIGVFLLAVAWLTSATLLQDSTQSDFNNGIYLRTFYNSSGFVQLNATFTSGSFTSRIFDVANPAQWNNLSWVQDVNYSSELLNDGSSEPSSSFGHPLNMSGNVLLIHFNNQSGENNTYFKDFSGTDNNGACPTLNKCPSLNSTGKFGKAYFFDSTASNANDDVVVIPYSNSANITSQITVESWVYWYGDASEGNLQNIVTLGHFARALRLTEDSPASPPDKFLSDFMINGTEYSVYSNTTIQKFRWYYVATTYNSSQLSLYVDGNLEAFTNVSGSIIGAATNTVIAGETDTNSYNFYGLIDEVAVYNRSLSAQEIQDRYARGVGRLNLSVRSCDDSACSGESFISSGSNSPQNLNSSGVFNNRYFQYLFNFTTDDTNYLPKLYNVNIDYTSTNIAPNVTISSPSNRTYNIAAIDLNYTVFDASGLDKCWYTKNSGVTNTTVTCGVNASGVVANQGSNTWTVYANDTSGLVNSSSITFSVDSIAPLIGYIAPTLANNSFTPQSFIYVNTSWTETNFANITFSLWNSSGLVNQTLFSSYRTDINWTNLPDGTYYFNVTLQDTFGNTNSTFTRMVTVDTTSPSVTISRPASGETFGTNVSLPLQFFVNDLGTEISSCWYTINSGLTNFSLPSCQNSTFNVTGNAVYNLVLYANDSAGNIGSDSKTFSVSLGAPSIQIVSPTNGAYLNHTSVTFFYNATSVNLQTCQLFGNFTGTYMLNQTRTTSSGLMSGLISNFTLTLNQGGYSWAVFCNDSFANSAVTGNSTLVIDTTAPVATLSAPSGTYSSLTGIPLTFSTFDASPVHCYYNYSLVGSPQSSNFNLPNCTSTSFSVGVFGNYQFYLSINDSAGNYNVTSTSFIVSQSSSSSGGGGGGSGGGGGGSSSGSSGFVKLNITAPSNSYIKRGQADKLVINVKNIGLRFLNSCSLSFKGDLATYLSNRETLSLSPGEVHDFQTDVYLPSFVDSGQYKVDLSATCNESTFNSTFYIVVIPTEFDYRFVKYERSVDELNISYVLEEQAKRDQTISINYSLKDSSNVEVTTGSEQASISPLSKTERSFVLKLPKDSVGEYTLYTKISNSDEALNLEDPIFLSAEGVTGLAISDNNLRTLRIFGIYIAAGLILIFVVRFIIKHHKNTRENLHLHTHRIKLHRFK